MQVPQEIIDGMIAGQRAEIEAMPSGEARERALAEFDDYSYMGDMFPRIPINQKAFLYNILQGKGGYDINDLSEAEKQSLYRTIMSQYGIQGPSGKITYEEQGGKGDVMNKGADAALKQQVDEGRITQEQYDEIYREMTPSTTMDFIKNNLSKSNEAVDYQIKTFLGQYDYHTNDKGEIIIKDTYDHHVGKEGGGTRGEGLVDNIIPTEQGSNPLFSMFKGIGTLLGSKSGEGNPVELNLGTIDYIKEQLALAQAQQQQQQAPEQSKRTGEIVYPLEGAGSTESLYANGGAVGEKGFIRKLIDQQIQQKMMQDQIDRDVAVQFTPSAGQVTNFAGMLAPGAGVADAAGEYPALPSYDQPVTEAFSQEPYPSMAENLKRGGFGGYFDASMQGLGVAGDALYAAPVVGPVLGATVGTGIKGIGALGAVAKAAVKSSKSGKGITALDETKRMLQAEVNTFAKDDLGFISPTMVALITKAPANLKGKQITEWAKANANKGVKPKELEFLGLDEFVAANPNATVRETIEGISGNKVKVSTNIRGGREKTMGFENTTPLEDPLDGSKVYQNTIDDIKYDLENMTPADEFTAYELLRTFKEANPSNPAKNLDEVETFLKSKGESLDDLVELMAESLYMEDPYIKITPTGTDAADDTFAFGNDDVGYSLFVDGNRVTQNHNHASIPYSEIEAQIQLRDAMAEQGYDFVRLEADEFDEVETQYKQFVDGSLPGGSNYREVVFNWDNAPVRHDATDHFDDDNQIAHALIRDRKLADGTDTLHGDEIQSDIHTQGSQDGYATPENIKAMQSQLKVKEQEILKQADIVEDMLIKKGIYQTTKPTNRLSTQEIFDNPNTPNDIKNSTIADYLDEIRSFNKKRPDDFDITYDDSAHAASELRDFLRNQQVPKDAPTYNPLTDFQFIDDEFSSIYELSNVTGQTNKLDYKLRNLVPNYPYKDDYYDMALKKMLLLAIEEGKPAISVSGSAPMKQRYSDRYAKFYETLYDKKIPSAMKKLSNKYGGEFEKNGSLDVTDTFNTEGIGLLDRIDAAADLRGDLSENATRGLLDANVIRITPEMKEKILKEGIQSFGTGGIVDSGITHLNTSKKKTDGIVAIATP